MDSAAHVRSTQEPIRYAVVGLGHIAQNAVLPAFEHADENARLTALVSGDPKKLERLGELYGVDYRCSYAEYDECLRSSEVDAVYIALPNHLHCEYSVRAAEAGCHVLCEKPMAVTEDECRRMIDAAAANDVRLMIAYRLHFETTNLKAAHLVQSGKIGEPRYFTSSFSMQVRAGNIRTRKACGGGTLYDIGIYCINAARYVFRDEPYEATAFSVASDDPRFSEVDEATTGVLRFPRDRLATFTASFGASDVSSYRVVGTKGDLRVEPAYGYVDKLEHHLTIDGKTEGERFSRRDQFAAEIVYFSNCIRKGTEPEPCGWEGLADVRIIEALYRSADEGRPIAVDRLDKQDRPTPFQDIEKPPVGKPELVHVESPSR
jgi:glucose-fructose oxidoreductase